MIVHITQGDNEVAKIRMDTMDYCCMKNLIAHLKGEGKVYLTRCPECMATVEQDKDGFWTGKGGRSERA